MATQVFAYVGNFVSDNVSVIDIGTNMVSTVIDLLPSGGLSANGVAITPDGTRAYVTNVGSNNVSVIDIGTNMVSTVIDLTTSMPSGLGPFPIAITPITQPTRGIPFTGFQ